jgi:hypothetical protein
LYVKRILIRILKKIFLMTQKIFSIVGLNTV